jgi:hypothetical protein
LGFRFWTLGRVEVRFILSFDTIQPPCKIDSDNDEGRDEFGIAKFLGQHRSFESELGDGRNKGIPG